MTSDVNKAGVNTAGFNWQKGGNLFGLGDLERLPCAILTQTHSGLESTVLMGHLNFYRSWSCELVS